ncbi:unnamed protein product [Staurois parvus]|uniref:Secreted protein n=1 Tax=Staurois parvus TaxID=386267 RepID=A0ABN9GIE8_9NEOB|nr:unnamed protein product [Staurois parvus]
MYVKCFDTVMFYYVILVIFVNVTFCHFQISHRSVPRTSRRSQRTEPEDRCRHPPDYIAGGHCRRDIAGAQDKVSDRGIPKQRRMVSPSVARGYRFWY